MSVFRRKRASSSGSPDAESKLVRDGVTGEVLGLWLSDRDRAQDDDFVLAVLANHDLLDAARQGMRRVPNQVDDNGGLFVMLGGNPAPGEPAAASGSSAGGAGSGKTLTINGRSYPVHEDFESFSRDAASGKLALF